MLSINSSEDAETHRAELRGIVWDGEIPVDRTPDRVKANISKSRFSSINGVRQIDRLTVEMRHGVTSELFVFYPETTQTREIALIYHQGHSGGVSHGSKFISAALAEGYVVLGMTMPLKGPNSNPTATTKHGQIRLESHDDFHAVRTANFSPLAYYLTPPVVAVTYLNNELGYESVVMTGISGGGWTTTLAAAVDTRINRSYSVADTLPLYLWQAPPNNKQFTHYEATTAEAHIYFNYLEYYLLASVGDNQRAHYQYLYQFDPCCSRGVGYQTYEPLLERRATALGGKFDTIGNETYRHHDYAPTVTESILSDISNTTEV